MDSQSRSVSEIKAKENHELDSDIEPSLDYH